MCVRLCVHHRAHRYQTCCNGSKWETPLQRKIIKAWNIKCNHNCDIQLVCKITVESIKTLKSGKRKIQKTFYLCLNKCIVYLINTDANLLCVQFNKCMSWIWAKSARIQKTYISFMSVSFTSHLFLMSDVAVFV